MNDSIRTGLVLLAGCIVFGGFFAFNLRKGDASVFWAGSVTRRSNPAGFWFVQGSLAVIALALLLAAIYVAF